MHLLQPILPCLLRIPGRQLEADRRRAEYLEVPGVRRRLAVSSDGHTAARSIPHRLLDGRLPTVCCAPIVRHNTRVRPLCQ